MTINDYYSMSDKAILSELGSRFKTLRLRRNVTQQELAAATTMSVNSIKALESGKGKLSTIVAVLRELAALDNLDSFIPVQVISPLQLAKQKGKVRQRASAPRGKFQSQEKVEW